MEPLSANPPPLRQILPFLESAGVAWMEERGCMSCHHVPFMIWTHRAAQTKGMMIDTKKLTEWDARGADGGWSWMKGGPSDPFTTGLSMYVLSRVGGSDPAVIVNARKYLLLSQQADGSWLTQSRNISNTTVPERLAARDEIYHYWGTAWATLGLLETL